MSARPLTVAPGDRICVTGGLGFIGSHLCRALSQRGYRVTCVDSLSGAYAAGTGRDALPRLEALGVRVVIADVAAGPFEPVLRDTRALIHLAGLPGVRSKRSFVDFWEQNGLVTARLAAETALRDQRLVLASTSSIYGDAVRLPTPEHSPACPLNPYALSKVAAENACFAAARERGADVVVARLFTVFGPGQRPDMAFSRWISGILRDEPIVWCAPPSARRELTYVGDAVRGLVAALERGRAGEAYNLPGCGSWPVAEALAEIEGLLGRSARVLVEDASGAEMVATEACGRKSSTELGYVPCVSLAEGLELQVDAALDARDPALADGVAA